MRDVQGRKGVKRNSKCMNNIHPTREDWLEKSVFVTRASCGISTASTRQNAGAGSRIIAMIPARMGSQRLKQNNLLEYCGNPMLSLVIHNCKATVELIKHGLKLNNTVVAAMAI